MPVTPHLFGMTPPDLVSALSDHGLELKLPEARRVLAHVLSGRSGFPTSRPVARRIEDAIAAATDRRTLRLVERVENPADGFVKYLFECGDGSLVESVRIPLEVPGRFSVCLSSQAGCAMACSFCATGRLGLTRNLEPWEIVAQFLAVREDTRGGEVTGALFQGQGEPLQNYAAVIKAAQILSDPCGGRISAKAITISTVGLVPAILRYAAEGHPYRLIVSLTSAIDEKRRTLVPLASRWPVAELAGAITVAQKAAGTRATIAWVMMSGVNTGVDEVEALRELFTGVPVRINLIDVNDARPDGYRPPGAEELAAFRDALRTLGVPVVRRYSGGAARHAACGMLANARSAGDHPAVV